MSRVGENGTRDMVFGYPPQAAKKYSISVSTPAFGGGGNKKYIGFSL